MSKTYVEMDAYYIRHTEAAICIALDEDTLGSEAKRYWVPKTLILDENTSDSEAKRYWVPNTLIDDSLISGDSIILYVEEWFAEKEELL